jgi:hypothetical protein
MIRIAFILLIGISSFSVSAQSDSVRVFFIGNIKGERFEVFWNGKLILNFKGSGSYKYSFVILREHSWEEKGRIEHLMIYRKGRLGLRYKDLNFSAYYEPKKYLVIWRNPMLKNGSSVQGSWSDKEPMQLPDV